MKIRLTENKLKQIVAESVRRVLKENEDEWNPRVPTADETILKKVKSGKMSLLDAAREFARLGWTHGGYTDIEATKKILRDAEKRCNNYKSPEDCAEENYYDAVRRNENPLGGLNRNDWA
jgi:uncharacterized membrane-anchored protein YjiN (DUF445 family)